LLIGMLKTWNLANVLKSISSQFTRLNVEVLIEQFDAICANSKETQQAAAAATHRRVRYRRRRGRWPSTART
jgi:type VI secretion system protein VasG